MPGTQSKYLAKIQNLRPDLSIDQKVELERFFDHHGTIKAWYVNNLLIMIDNNLTDYMSRWDIIRSSTKYTLKWFNAQYGDYVGTKLYQEKKTKSRRNWTHYPEYWLDRGYSLDEALQKLSEVQSSTSAKVSKAHSGKRDHSVRCIEYWLKLGHSEEEAKIKILEKQSRGKEFFVGKYGDVEGSHRYNESKRKRAVGISKASKESRRFFDPIAAACDQLGLSYYYGIEGNHELFLPNPDRSRYNQTNLGFDFAIPSKRLVLEYHGKIFHPKTQNDSAWQNPFLPERTSEDQWAFDQFKLEVVQSHGYEVITIWYDDSYDNIVPGLLSRL